MLEFTTMCTIQILMEELQLLGRALSNMVMVDKLKTAYISFNSKDLDEFNYEKGDTEGVVNYALSLERNYICSYFY